MGGFFSAPIDAGVSDWLISRIGTRMSGREPSTWILREFGSGWMAASSTLAVAARNWGLAFMMLLCYESEGAAETRRMFRVLPFAGIIQIRFEGVSHPPIAWTGPLACAAAAAWPELYAHKVSHY